MQHEYIRHKLHPIKKKNSLSKLEKYVLSASHRGEKHLG